ncbi:protein of unknown function [Methylorubrum extorquens DM4]|uniref:Uncharacterized protein n=1 Tax=Methylorubrum extorquens (strain DSM 6343 / CIP 106787 / DM4) TaxID=661410 RepID=C7CGE6_METED|nr:protein of unknown function [Methylorubrum extorquens DM4]
MIDHDHGPVCRLSTIPSSTLLSWHLSTLYVDRPQLAWRYTGQRLQAWANERASSTLSSQAVLEIGMLSSTR